MAPDSVWYFIPYSLKRVIQVLGNFIPGSVKEVTWFLGSPGVCSYSTPPSCPISTVFHISMYFLLLLNILVSFFYGTRLGGIL